MNVNIVGLNGAKIAATSYTIRKGKKALYLCVCDCEVNYCKEGKGNTRLG